ncbi:hypothetical protein PGT21_021845 [Puccinia graminis f. sp. tritici]|uniref:Uncharacterized protein n=1 Tax=Puccinia graminis f. sp. tritici TaxID=56615 RepID=A0A5B0NQW2_PUCGR|nr:hypothetical protein PGT21_021845 [Puccinia graminis f. sp. tritici]KAA1125440.1 hypothetical protein PGTUg99_011945 [Puccinia graminis f. sp. tritici]
MTSRRKKIMVDPPPSSTTSSSTEESSDAPSPIGPSKRTSQANPPPATTNPTNLAVGGSRGRPDAATVTRVQTATTPATAPGPAHTNAVYHPPIVAPNPQHGHLAAPASGPINHYGPAPYHNPPNPAPIPANVGHHQANQLTHQPNQLNYQHHQTNHQPNQLTHQPNQLNHQPNQLNYQPNQLNHQPHQTNHQLNHQPHQPYHPPHPHPTYASEDQIELERYLRFVHVNPHSKVLQNALDELGITHYSFFEFFSVDELVDLGIRIAHARALLNGLKKFDRIRRMSV